MTRLAEADLWPMMRALRGLEQALDRLERRDRARQAARTAGLGVMHPAGSESASSARPRRETDHA